MQILCYAVIVSLFYNAFAFAQINSNGNENLNFDYSLIENKNFIDFLESDFELIRGEHILEVFINDVYSGQSTFQVRDFEFDNKSLCFNDDFLVSNNVINKLDYASKYHEFKYEPENCYFLSEDSNTHVKIEPNLSRVSISIPQAYFLDSEEIIDYETGVNAGRISYDLSLYDSFNGEFGYIGRFNSKFNFGRWISNIDTHFSDTGFELSSLSFYTPLYEVNSYLNFGQLQSNSPINSNFGFMGISLASSQRMKSANRVGYSPIISGNLESTSDIKIYQNGLLLKQARFPTGPFIINDLVPVSTGDLEVLIEGEEGKIEKRIYPVTVIPELIRPNSNDYSLSIGYKNHGLDLPFVDENDIPFINGSYSQGLEYLTVNAETILSKEYQSYGMQLASQLGSFGAISTTLNRVRYSDKYNDVEYANSFSVKYSRSFGQLTNLQLLSYQYKDLNYLDFSQYGDGHNNYKPRSRYEGRISTKFIGSNISGSLWSEEYWDKDYLRRGLTISSSFDVSKLLVSLLGSYYQDEYGDSFFLSLNLGLNSQSGNERYNLYSSFQEGSVSHTASASMWGDKNDFKNLSLFYSEQTQRLSATYQSENNLTRYSLNTYYEDSVDRSRDFYFNGSIQGSVYWTEETGLGLTQRVSETIAIVDIDDTPDVRVGSSITNDDGLAVVSLQPYTENKISLNTTKLPTYLKVSSGEFSTHPTRGAVVYKKSEVVPIYNYYFRLYENSLFSNDIKVTNRVGNQVGYGDDSLIIVTMEKFENSIYIEDDNGNSCIVELSNLVPNNDEIQYVRCMK